MVAAVEMRDVRKSFGSVGVIDGVDLTVEKGEFVVFVGPSGSGKSTLLRMIAGLETTTGGDIIIDDRNVTYADPAERGIAMVFQSYALYPHMNIFDNIAFNLRLARRSKSEVDDRVQEAARILKLQDLLDRSPAQLSGGQRQRVAIGRAIVRNPKVFLFDEPLSNLDAGLRVQMRLEIERLHRELGSTMIYVTHDQVEAMTLADRIVALDGGRIQQVGTPLELYHHPNNLFVAGFIGSPKMNLLAGRLTMEGGPGVTLDGPAGSGRIPLPGSIIANDQRVTLGIRPEQIAVSAVSGAVGAGLTARVETIERLGNVTYTYLDAGLSEMLTVQVAPDFAHAVGDSLEVTFDPALLHLFDAAGAAIAM